MLNFFINNSLYIVLVIVLMIWFGISMFMLSLDKKVSKLEKQFKENEKQ